MNLTCRFAFNLTSRELVTLAHEGFKRALPPVALPEHAAHKISLYLSPVDRLAAEDYAEINRFSAKDALEQAAYAAYRSRTTATELMKNGAAPAQETRRNRELLLSILKEVVDKEQIGIAEASTGLGKSRILARLARYILEKPKTIVWVAAPTLAVLRHLLDQYQKDLKDGEKFYPPAVLMGRQQFVSIERLASLMADEAILEEIGPQQVTAINEWVTGGCLPQTPACKLLASFIPEISHLCDDIQAIAPDLSPSDYCLLSKARKQKTCALSEPADIILEQLNAAASESRLVFLTHAMLVRKRIILDKETALPCTHLLVDEAHELEAIAANSCSHALSLVGFRSWLRHSNLCKKKELIGKVTDLIKTLNGGDTPEGFNQTATTKALIRRQFEGFHKSIAGARKGLDENTRWYCDVLSRIVKAQDSWIGLSFSETRRFPTISSGPCSVSWLLHRIWDGVASAVLVSGTLVVPSGDESGLSYWYSKMKLALPDARYRAVGPITMSWVYSSPKLMVPHPDDCAALSYPQSVKKKALSSEELEADTEVVEKDADPRYVAWADAVARVILKAANTSKGGGLVLCTSYKDIEAFKDRLSISLGDRLISQSRLTGFASAHAKFLELTAKKKRPFWLATGPAWTGLDLSDPNIAAEDDFIVTDLIMPRMPYGLNRSSTHWHLRGRVKRVDLTEAAAQARQGTGRLIRREGLTHRRLWMLDGRIFTGARPAFTPLRALLRPYKNVEQFKIT